ncbi:sigma factor [Dyella ginsengisoli]|uniref:sigma factor n=1 Tax=Dyella ginsengisoli TaxID=363848 RepID=UPI00384B18ED
MDVATATFRDLRPRLQGIAYRLLGSVSESEDIVQDVWLRCHAAPQGCSAHRAGDDQRPACRAALYRWRAGVCPVL